MAVTPAGASAGLPLDTSAGLPDTSAGLPLDTGARPAPGVKSGRPLGVSAGHDQPRLRHFVRLKLRILRNSLRGQGLRVGLFVAGIAIGALTALTGFAIFAAVGLISVDIGFIVTAFGTTLLTLVWLLAPLLFFGVDETLDPARFALLPLRKRTLAGGILLAALVGVPPMATLVGTLGIVVGSGLAGGPAAGAVALVGVLLGLFQCLAASRALTSAFARMLRSRRVRDLAAIVIAIASSSVGLVPALAMSALDGVSEGSLLRVAGLLGWTPLAGPYLAGYDVAAGRPLTALARLLLSAVTIAALCWWWSTTIESAMIGVAAGGIGAGRSAGAEGGAVDRLFPRLFRLAPRRRYPALVAREYRYWWRDPRRRAGLVSILIAAVALPVALEFAGRSGIGLQFAVAMSGVMGGLLIVNQFGYDGAAYAVHLLVGVPGRTELRARAGAVALMLLPLLILVTVAVAVRGSGAGALPGALGTLFAGFGSALATGTLLSVLAPYPVPESGNPFAMNSGSGGAKGVLSLAAMTGALVLAAPVTVAGLLLTGDWDWLVAVGGLGYGATAVFVATGLAGARLDRRGPELLAAITPRR